MSDEPRALARLGGISFIVSGLLFFLRYLLDLATGPPPSSGAEILEWVASNKLGVSLVSEVLFFAAGFLVPAVIALHQALAGIGRTRAAVGCGMLAATIPVIFMALVVHGRLVYPMYGIENHDPAVAELIVSVFYGGIHAVGLLLAIATVAVSLALRRERHGMAMFSLGIATAAFDVIGSYPDRIGPIWNLVSQGLLAAWFVALGWWLWRAR